MFVFGVYRVADTSCLGEYMCLYLGCTVWQILAALGNTCVCIWGVQYGRYCLGEYVRACTVVAVVYNVTAVRLYLGCSVWQLLMCGSCVF